MAETGAGLLDLDRYDLDGVRADIMAILRPAQAMGMIARVAFGVALLSGVLAAILFWSRMPGWVAVPFIVLCAAAAVPAAIGLGAFFVVRDRVERTSAAATRAVGLVQTMHGDYFAVRAGAASLSIRALATEVAEEVAMPILIEQTDQTLAFTGPFARLARPFVMGPLRQVERSVIATVGQLPDTRIGGGSGEVDATALSSARSELAASYEGVLQRIERIVESVGVGLRGSVIVAALVSLVPVIGLFVVGWLLS